MSGCKLFVHLALLSLIPAVRGHGYLKVPPGRSTWWTEFDDADRPAYILPNYNHMGLNCGGFSHQWNVNGGRCGICGDPYDGVRENEAGGKYASGYTSRTYQQGQTIDVAVRITADHKGFFEFRLCPHNNPTVPATQSCLDRYLLQLEDGSTRYTWTQNVPFLHKFKVRLPADVTCQQCVLQWKYNTGNSWGCDFDDEKGCAVGLGPQEQFYGCSDVAINAADTSESSTATTEMPSESITDKADTSSGSTTASTTISSTSTAANTEKSSESTTDNTDTYPKSETASTKISSTSTAANTEKSSESTTENTDTYPKSETASTKISSGSTPNNSEKSSESTPISTSQNSESTTATTVKGVESRTTTEMPDTSSTVKQDLPTTQQGSVCVPVQPHDKTPGMYGWCRDNCAQGYCPASHCVCITGTPATKQEPVCVPVPPHDKTLGMDGWCRDNCAQGNCPASHCMCTAGTTAKQQVSTTVSSEDSTTSPPTTLSELIMSTAVTMRPRVSSTVQPCSFFRSRGQLGSSADTFCELCGPSNSCPANLCECDVTVTSRQCVGVGEYSGLQHMEDFCSYVCSRSSDCPQTMCTCV